MCGPTPRASAAASDVDVVDVGAQPRCLDLQRARSRAPRAPPRSRRRTGSGAAAPASRATSSSAVPVPSASGTTARGPAARRRRHGRELLGPQCGVVAEQHARPGGPPAPRPRAAPPRRRRRARRPGRRRRGCRRRGPRPDDGSSVTTRTRAPGRAAARAADGVAGEGVGEAPAGAPAGSAEARLRERAALDGDDDRALGWGGHAPILTGRRGTLDIAPTADHNAVTPRTEGPR